MRKDPSEMTDEEFEQFMDEMYRYYHPEEKEG